MIVKFLTFFTISLVVMAILYAGDIGESHDLVPGIPADPVEVAQVSVAPVRSGILDKALVAFGKISHERNLSLRFVSSGVIAGVAVEEGERVKAGDRLAWLDTLDAFLDFRMSNLQLEAATLRKNELLISYGGKAFDDSSVDSIALNNINLQSNYELACIEKRKRKKNLEQRYLIAPFDGVVANMSVQIGEYVMPGSGFADLFDESSYLVQFNWQYAEVDLIRPGTKIDLQTLSGKQMSWPAKIVRINPQVDEHGLLEVTARFWGGSTLVFPEGLLVKILVKETREAELIVPAVSLIKRNGQDAVFLLDPNKSISVFSPVEILNQTEEELEVRGNFQPGDLVLTAGHLFLKQDSEVKVVNQKPD